jgi:hypothetical protein
LLLAFCLIYVPGPGAQVVFDEFAFFNYSISPENLEVGDGVTLTVKPGDVSVAGELKFGEDAKIIFDMKGAGEDEKKQSKVFRRCRSRFPLETATCFPTSARAATTQSLCQKMERPSTSIG